MGSLEEGQNLERIFTLSEANRLIPQLEQHLASIKLGKCVLVRVNGEVRRASSKAEYGGGTFAGTAYIRALEQIGHHLHSIQELGVLIKDLDMGLCDFPSYLNGRIVYLCWKHGEPEISWWHDVDSGYAGRRPIEFSG